MTYDIQRIRGEFPLLQQTMRGKPLAYLDNAATSQKPRAVLHALDDYYEHYNANVHRGIYEISEKATTRYEEARDKVAGFINAFDRSEVIFTRNATEALNLVAYAWGLTNLQKGDIIVLSEMEHHSNLIPWQLLNRRIGARLEFIPVFGNGRLDLEDLDKWLKAGAKLVSVTMMSNVLGSITPIQEIARRCRAHGALLVVDGAQGVAHLGADVQKLDCDFLAFSGHKMCGPTGIGVLWGRRELLEKMDPFMGGGEMISKVEYRTATWNDLPWKFEAGTPSIAQAIGLGAAVDYLQRVGMEAIHDHESDLVHYAWQRMNEEIPGIRMYGPPPWERGGIVAFTLEDVHPHDVATVLDQEGVAIRAGHHCAMPWHNKIGLSATARASFYLYNTRDEIDRLVAGLKKCQHFFAPSETKVFALGGGI
jgi:cysteine desulfurase/selenocysteine lyase